MVILSTPTWIELYGELSVYVEGKVFPDRITHDDDGNRLEETQDDFVEIVNEVELIMSQFFKKEEDNG
jgi:hypothetical protein|tara:strand:- start:364 stop:567 length:204 start_codon:yes stop_codon:yes gene_type:complete